MKYKLKRPLMPEGTVVDTENTAPTKTERMGGWSSVLISLDTDHTIDVCIDNDALEECKDWFEMEFFDPLAKQEEPKDAV